MKTKLIYVIAFVCFAQFANAQTFGIKGGVNFANMTYSEDGISASPKAITGFHLGLVADFTLQEKLHFNTGLLYSMKGSKAEDEFMGQTYKDTYKVNFLEIPLNLAYNFAINETSDFFVQAGPYLAYGLSGKEEYTGEADIDIYKEKMAKRFDYGVGFGAGVQFGSIVTSINYQLGLADLNNEEDDVDSKDFKIKNKVFQISVAYMFGSKK